MLKPYQALICMSMVCATITFVVYNSDHVSNSVKTAASTMGLSTTNDVVEWEHGFKTDRVVATRYANTAIGYNIGFKFTQNPNESDRLEISDFMEMYNGHVYQSGGYPGAETYVKFDDVTNQASANQKIHDILPALSKLITDLGNGVTVKIPGYEKRKVDAKKAADAEIALLRDKARTLIPFVQDAQASLLKKYQDDLIQDQSGWKFGCVRKGDYLSITIIRNDSVWDGTSIVQQPRTTVLAVSLAQKPSITYEEGSAPDLGGYSEFIRRAFLYEGDKNISYALEFPNVTLPNQIDTTRKINWEMLGTSVNGSPYDRLGVAVWNIARPSVDDKVVIGAGGGSQWEDFMAAHTSGAFYYTTENEALWKQPRPGATLKVPHGLGKAVYDQIMDAIAKGVPAQNNP